MRSGTRQPGLASMIPRLTPRQAAATNNPDVRRTRQQLGAPVAATGIAAGRAAASGIASSGLRYSCICRLSGCGRTCNLLPGRRLRRRVRRVRCRLRTSCPTCCLTNGLPRCHLGLLLHRFSFGCVGRVGGGHVDIGVSGDSRVGNNFFDLGHRVSGAEDDVRAGETHSLELRHKHRIGTLRELALFGHLRGPDQWASCRFRRALLRQDHEAPAVSVRVVLNAYLVEGQEVPRMLVAAKGEEGLYPGQRHLVADGLRISPHQKPESP
mmetsp:Transcript_147879/g.375874  ORF Transcript_147879/g.375874 Transcript_147879/m.375874 type:complete len:267 (-) Transcript_147879:1954-2754(-)